MLSAVLGGEGFDGEDMGKRRVGESWLNVREDVNAFEKKGEKPVGKGRSSGGALTLRSTG